MEVVLQISTLTPLVHMIHPLESSEVWAEEAGPGWKDLRHVLVRVWHWYVRTCQHLGVEGVLQILEEEVLLEEMVLEVVLVLELVQLLQQIFELAAVQVGPLFRDLNLHFGDFQTVYERAQLEVVGAEEPCFSDSRSHWEALLPVAAECNLQ